MSNFTGERSDDVDGAKPPLDYAVPTSVARWRRRLVVSALFMAGAGVAAGFTVACAYFLDPNLLPHF